MIAVGVADEDMGDFTALQRRHQRLKMRLILRAGIDDGDGTVADDIGVGAMESEGRRIVDGEALDQRGDRNRLAISRLKIEIECRVRHQDLLNECHAASAGAARRTIAKPYHAVCGAAPKKLGFCEKNGRRVIAAPVRLC
ncbi:hypothetical protein D3C80_989130 [compost metagenome]